MDCYPDNWPAKACEIADALDDLVKEIELSGLKFTDYGVDFGAAFYAARRVLEDIGNR